MPRRSRPLAVEPYRGSLVGRELDLQAIEGLVGAGARLVTMLGPGGVGKTRLLHRLVQRLGVIDSWFCDLTSARTAGDVVSRVATTAFGAATLAGATADEAALRVGRAVERHGRCLLALDNLEQLEDAALPLLGAWLGQAPELVVLATSRVMLGVAGEVVHRLAPLSLLRDDSGIAPALRLFEERARAVREPFTVDEAPNVLRIVTLLEGMPLALEMAAARLALLSPVELLERLARPLEVLTTTKRTDPDRHASLARVLDGSWQLLDDTERRALTALGVFVGGFTVEAAEALVDIPGSALPSLERLVDSSLVRAMPSRTGRARHAPYEVVREYAIEKLTASGDLDDAKRRHALWFASWADTRIHQIEGGTETELATGDLAQLAFAELVDDEANLAAATAFAALSEDADSRRVRLRLLCALEPLRTLRGQLDVLAKELASALDGGPSGPIDAPLVARAHLALARSLHELGRAGPARVAYDRALKEARVARDPTVEGLAFCCLGRLIAGLGEWEEALALFDAARSLPGTALRVQRLARACFEFYGTEIGASSDEVAAVSAYVEVCRRAADPRELAFWLVQLGRVESELIRERGPAERHFEEALALARRTGDLRGEGFTLFGLGSHWMAYGPLERAVSVLTEAAATLREAGTRRYEAWAIGFLGVTHARAGDLALAVAALDEAITLLRAVGDGPRESLLLAFRASTRARLDDLEGAVRDLGAARKIAPAASRYHGWTIDLCAAQIDVARAREAARRGEADVGREHIARAEALLARAGWTPDGSPEPRKWPWGEELFEPRIAAQLLDDAMTELVAPRGALRVASDGSYFVLPSGEHVVCPGRGKLQSIVRLLARERAARPGTAVPAAALVAAAWGDERMKRDAAANRLHVALDSLKKLGLRPSILRGEGGWLLDPELPFAWAPVVPSRR